MTATAEPPTQTKKCPVCLATHEGIFSHCADCLETGWKSAQKVKEIDDHAARVKAWVELCPTLYASTNWKHAGLSPHCAEIARTWWATGSNLPWLGIVGTTGIGKTRAMWEIVRRHHFAGRKCLAVDSVAFARAATDWHADDKETKAAARALIRRTESAGILFFDDLGKEKRLSPAVGQALHDLFEQRARFRRTTLWTSEKTGDELAARFGEDYADGIIRRLREFSDIIAA